VFTKRLQVCRAPTEACPKELKARDTEKIIALIEEPTIAK